MNDTKRFKVFIIESPSKKDMLVGMSEGEPIQKSLAAAGIPVNVRTAENKADFLQCLAVVREQLCREKTLIPILHFSAHGDAKGIYLTSEEFFAWEDLIEILAELNKALQERLIICMSSCEGLRAWKMNLIHDPPAFSVLVGTEDKPTWGQTIIGFTEFYRMMSKGKTVKEAVSRMKAESRNPHFMIVPGKKVQQIRKNVMRKTSKELNELRAAIRQVQDSR